MDKSGSGGVLGLCDFSKGGRESAARAAQKFKRLRIELLLDNRTTTSSSPDLCLGVDHKEGCGQCHGCLGGVLKRGAGQS